MGDSWFVYDERLGIEVPELTQEWESYPVEVRSAILDKWETIRGRIPDRIRELEQRIRELQRQLDEEEDFEASCRLNADIAEQASRINDLNIWYRINQTIDPRRHY